MAAKPFPDTLKPNERSYKAGTFPTRVYRAMSGATVKRSFGNKPTSCELRLRYNNIADSAAAVYVNHYNETAGGFERFALTPSSPKVYVGMSQQAQDAFINLSGIKWEYAGPPEIEYGARSLCSMTITLIGELTA